MKHCDRCNKILGDDYHDIYVDHCYKIILCNECYDPVSKEFDRWCNNEESILEKLKQEDYELWIRTQGKSHLSEEQWDWLIETVKERSKNEATKESINMADQEANKEVKQEV